MTKIETLAARVEALPEAYCIVSNCRQRAPATEALCAKHRARAGDAS